VRRKFAFASNLGAMAELTGGVYRPDEANLGDAFGWASRDPDWISKLLLMGLIGLIPIVGALQLAGWMLVALDNLRAGRHEVPPAAFRYASRGVWLFLAGVIYAIIFTVVFYGGFFAIFLGLIPAGSASAGHTTGSANQPPLILFPLMFGWVGFFGLGLLGMFLLVPLIIEFTDRQGLTGAFNFGGFIRAIRDNPKETLAAGGLALMTYFISGTGTYLCYVGIIFTMPYSLTVLAGVLRWYETRVRRGTLPA
jgi:hypothetical protein